MIQFTEEQMAEARRQMVKAMFVLTTEPQFTPSLAAKNVMFHAEEFMKALDAFYAGDGHTLNVFTGE